MIPPTSALTVWCHPDSVNEMITAFRVVYSTDSSSTPLGQLMAIAPYQELWSIPRPQELLQILQAHNNSMLSEITTHFTILNLRDLDAPIPVLESTALRELLMSIRTDPFYVTTPYLFTSIEQSVFHTRFLFYARNSPASQFPSSRISRTSFSSSSILTLTASLTHFIPPTLLFLPASTVISDLQRLHLAPSPL